MIYLVGGPPRCGKTTLAKQMSKKFRLPWISTDTLENVAGAYWTKEELIKNRPYSELRRRDGDKSNDTFYEKYSAKKIISVLKGQSLPIFKAIEMVAVCEITDGNDYIIEGYHITPDTANRLVKKYGEEKVKVIFLTKQNAVKFARDVKKSSTPNDWLLVLTKKKETFLKVGKMIAEYSKYFEIEAKKYGFKVFNMDNNFFKQISKAIDYLK
ncbi:MAG TPA: hypothetical protein DEB09_01415 [Candidatus Magasanikbacteria bacterium]|nr:hypothetical protein [Candidatus Magasanikbacteria bacterium]